MSFEAKRLSLRVLGLLFLMSLVNYYANWHLFGEFDTVVIISFIPLIMLHFYLIGPSVEEIEEYRQIGDLQSGKQRRFPLEVSPITRNVVTALLAISILLTSVNYFEDLRWFGGYYLEPIALSLALFALARQNLKPRKSENEEGEN